MYLLVFLVIKQGSIVGVGVCVVVDVGVCVVVSFGVGVTGTIVRTISHSGAGVGVGVLVGVSVLVGVGVLVDVGV